ncbi:MAG: hypothetical protein MUP66_00115 [Candidatus Nanohaloarchaeota archaeon QJJ-5]|nr:hypothetical protein [Candidatus Nanohaloarchaeota archaeon QJJ-5]
MIDKQLDAIEELDTDLRYIEQEIETLRDRWERAYEQKQSYVVEALETIQQDLDEDETVPLVETEEFGRGGHYQYEEHLTPEGVIATNIERVNRNSKNEDGTAAQLYLWRTGDQPLALDEEYLQTRERDTPGFYDKLVDRLEAIDNGSNRLPELHTSYD